MRVGGNSHNIISANSHKIYAFRQNKLNVFDQIRQITTFYIIIMFQKCYNEQILHFKWIYLSKKGGINFVRVDGMRKKFFPRSRTKNLKISLLTNLNY